MELNKDYTKILGTDAANTIDDTNSTQIDEIEADMTTIETDVTTAQGSITTLESRVDQDVTSGASPTFDNDNFTATTNKNYATDAEKIILGNTSGTNTGDNSANTTYADDYRAANFEAGTDYQAPLTADTDYLTPGTAGTTYEPIKGEDDNYVTDAEKTVIGNTSNTNSGDQSASDFNHDDLANITGTASQYNHPTDAQMTVLGNTSNTNTGDQTISDETITTTDVTTNDMSTSKHGFAPKGSGVAGQFLDSSGGWSAPSGSGDVLGPATNTDGYIPQWDGANSKTLKNGISLASILSEATWGDFV